MNNTPLALFSLRISIFILMIVWAGLKVIAPVSYAGDGADNPGIFAGFYGVGLGETIVLVIGVLQILFLIAYVLGLFKTITTGGVLLMNVVTFLVVIPNLMMPFEKPNLLFLASLPVLGASLAHFLMRKQDTFLSLGK